jgi:hypothetical protein
MPSVVFFFAGLSLGTNQGHFNISREVLLYGGNACFGGSGLTGSTNA